MIEELNRMRRGYSFLTAEDSFPLLYSTEEVVAANKQLVAHYYIGQSSWYLAEADLETHRAFGWVVLNGDLMCSEWGYFSLVELEELVLRVPVDVEGVEVLELVVERNLDWVACPARECLPVEAWEWSVRDE